MRVGSHLYGLNHSASDEDFLGVFMPEKQSMFGLAKCEVIDLSTKKSFEDRRNTKEDVDEKWYSLPKFIHLLSHNNPNILEVLFATKENILFIDPIFQQIIDNRDKFVSKNVYHRFSGFAYSQKKKIITKRERYLSLCSTVDWLNECFPIVRSDTKVVEHLADQLNRRIKYYKSAKEDCNSFTKGLSLQMVIEKLTQERDRYGWRVKTDTFQKLGYDVKFASQGIRLFSEGRELLTTGSLKYPLKNSGDDVVIKSVKDGRVSYEDVLKLFDFYKRKCDKAYEVSTIRDKPDHKWISKWLIDTQFEFCKNF